jgi:type IV pilus assembly protein PilV
MNNPLLIKLSTKSKYTAQCGASMIEVLVTFFILAVGLLGMLAMHTRLQQSEMDSYQRSQALLLLNDMANRLTANRNAAATYVTGTTAVGAGMTCPTSTGTTKEKDMNEWCNALQGASETQSTSRLGAMVGGRGCVESLGSGRYMITVAWQGLTPLSAPPSSVACGKDSYDGTSGSACVNDLCRRVVTTIVRVATL